MVCFEGQGSLILLFTLEFNPGAQDMLIILERVFSSYSSYSMSPQISNNQFFLNPPLGKKAYLKVNQIYLGIQSQKLMHIKYLEYSIPLTFATLVTLLITRKAF